uniref:Putative disease resistance protein (TIR-NBS-LRR class), putative n=1 Tax=Helianthus annuus TaxID=4232 RepID=A0A251TR03_HELAN
MMEHALHWEQLKGTLHMSDGVLINGKGPLKIVSVSSIQKRFKYDVFLSFRGEDTRKTIVDHLYHALHNRGIITYKDDEKIEKGKRINDQLLRSIEDSRIYIIVFSKNYASSSWCLDELVQIMECHKTTGRTAYPVFFNVEPTEVRHQSGVVKEAFAKHEKKEAAGKWRDAMKAAADLAGRELKTTFDGHEAKFIQKIVEDISLELRFIDSSVDEKLIGMETRTTLARAVFNYISIWYEGKSFVENVREASKGSGLKKLQQQVLKDVLNDKSIDITSVYEGEMMMKKMLGSRKVLIVLDDVDDIEQLEALAGENTWFKPGSTIIITTRDEHVLVAHRVKSIHDVNLLSHEEGIRLFSKYAFGREIPIEGYEELSRKVVHYAAGLPLTIKVLGSSLCGKTECEWSDAIERLKTIPEKQTLKRLELSFIGLEHDHKEVFLEVACILKGETTDKAIRILESCGFHARFALKVLEQKSLMTVSDYGCIHMHDRLEEMGRNIVRRLHPREPQRHNRLWDTKEIENILVNELGTKATLSIRLMYTKLHPTIIMKGLRKMKKLRFLYVCRSNHLGTTNEVDIYLPNTLQSLHWDGYPFLCLPNTFSASKVVNIEMDHSKMSQLWEGGERKVLNELRFLNISHSKLRTFDLGLTPQLEWLDLSECDDFVELHMPVESLKLKSLTLSGCMLSKHDMGLIPQLETLDLNRCKDLVEFHMPVESPKLKSLVLNGSKLSKLDLGVTPQLETLDLGECKDLVELHMPVECLKLYSLVLSGSKLSKFDMRLTPQLETFLGECIDLVELHMPIECPKLCSLVLSGSKLSKLDLGLTPQLKTLDLGGCKDLVELHMPTKCSTLKSLVISGSKLSKLNLGLTPQLERLDLEKCYYLQEIHASVGSLENLVNLKLSGCLGFERFVGSNLYVLPCIDSLATLELIAESLDKCQLHPNNNLPKFQFKCFYEDPLPSSSGNLEKLLSFGMCACTNLESFPASICSLQRLRKLTLEGSFPEVPKDLYQLESLQELTLSMKEIKHLPDTICMLKHLKYLNLRSCWLLEQLPINLGQLECLEMLILTDCLSLQDIPNNICQIRSLEYLHIPYCILVDKLPEELGRLECLKELNIEGAGISRLPQSIFESKGLRIIGTRWRLESYGFTSLSTVSSNKTCCYVKL